MRNAMAGYDFGWIRETNTKWASQRAVCQTRSRAMMAALLHYDLDVSALIRYLGNNYTGEYRLPNISAVANILTKYNIPQYLIDQYQRVLVQGCPAHFVADTTRDNALEYWRGGNNPSINANLDKVLATMAKEDRNAFVIALPSWLWRFIPHVFRIPHHLLVIPKKKDRLICDASFRHSAASVSANMMTSTDQGVELVCEYGAIKKNILTRIWNLRITYPTDDIVIHANDVKSCFRQLKHHPDVAGAFSYILGDFLFVQCSLTFGADFSPPSWEGIRRIAELLAEALFDDKSLRTKHRKYLDLLTFGRDLGRKAVRTVAKQDALNPGVRARNKTGDVNTPHHFFVDDDVYCDVYDVVRNEQAIASSIESVFILLGESDLASRQDPLSWDKMKEMLINYLNKVLGQIINTRTMMVSTPPEYIAALSSSLTNTWLHRKSFSLREISELTGRLGFVSDTAPWLRFLMSHLYTSIASALGLSHAHLYSTNKSFREMVKTARVGGAVSYTNLTLTFDQKARDISFARSRVGKAVYNTPRRFFINRTLMRELALLHRTFTSDWIRFERPIGHFVDRIPSGKARGDSSLKAAGGFSVKMQFWWYIEWPETVRKRTLLFISQRGDKRLISINVLEYATIIINYIASTHYFTVVSPDAGDPYPVVLIEADNTSAESWTMKACKSSCIGRELGLLQCALMITNPVGVCTGRVSTEDNIIADGISRVEHSANADSYFCSLIQDYPQLRSCQQFHPSAELVSSVIRILLQDHSVEPLTLSRQILGRLGKSTT